MLPHQQNTINTSYVINCLGLCDRVFQFTSFFPLVGIFKGIKILTFPIMSKQEAEKIHLSLINRNGHMCIENMISLFFYKYIKTTLGTFITNINQL